MLNWNYLETFVVLSENLSFSETAKVLNTAQPVISRQIKVLEQNLGYSLFVRTKKSVVLSKEGQELKRKLGPLVEEMKRVLMADRNTLSSLIKVDLRIGSLTEAGESILLPMISQFLEMHPESKAQLQFMASAEANEKVAKGQLDFAFVNKLSELKSIKVFPVTEDVPVLITEKKNAAKWKKQEVYNFFGYRENDSYMKSFIDRHMNKTERSKIRYHSSVNSHKAIVSLICRHKGMAVIPKTSAQPFVDQGVIEIIDQDKKPKMLSLICHEQILIDKRKKAFLDYLLAEFKKI